ncbi:hypothetical protein [Mucilaginibacter dorajii]|uniref:Uncharacterized protein n=1 Tax=Mucilaginibacter dorajii TaxID=692994 RepID=A0ABP7QL54_9SPHI|nr:hypothetical protein [Mucilaginibacter dorajii]MCS3735975.1 hypothetical protein [Mucilaginibacter dorajii]
MKYYFKPGYRLFFLIVIVIIWIGLLWYNSNSLSTIKWTICGALAFTLFILFYNNFKSIVVAIEKKPQLEFDEICIYDRVKGVKYYWKDIEEVAEESGSHMITAYPLKIKTDNGEMLKRDSPKYIKLGNVDAHLSELLTMLNNYSIKALEIEQREKNKAAL